MNSQLGERGCVILASLLGVKSLDFLRCLRLIMIAVIAVVLSDTIAFCSEIIEWSK